MYGKRGQGCTPIHVKPLIEITYYPKDRGEHPDQDGSERKALRDLWLQFVA
ncbi:MAG: hypothetical protein Q6362_006140 [Candidatus Wukongarchaeota archaeon]|nr:hypothetical protein [Candidatus Wukongarchaeota archaeon]